MIFDCVYARTDFSGLSLWHCYVTMYLLIMARLICIKEFASNSETTRPFVDERFISELIT